MSFQGISLCGLRGFSVAEVFVSSSSHFMFSFEVYEGNMLNLLIVTVVVLQEVSV